jgi:hypothetical protein
MVELNLHSPIHLHRIVLNYIISTRGNFTDIGENVGGNGALREPIEVRDTRHKMLVFM